MGSNQAFDMAPTQDCFTSEMGSGSPAQNGIGLLLMSFHHIVPFIVSALCWDGWGVALLLELLQPSTSDASLTPNTLSLDN